MGNNRGVSGVVGIVLTVLMAIVGVGILWIAVLSYLDLDSGLNVGMVRIDTDGGYTVYDENEGIACVHVVRNDEEIDEIKILFIIQGNSHTVFINNANIPAPNNKKVYCVNLSNYGSPTSVVVIPILNSKEGPGSEYSIPYKLINPDAIEDIRSGRRGLYYVDDDPAIPVMLSECGVLNVEGGHYILENNLSVSGDCFTIEADGVTLDLGGNTVTSGGYAVSLNPSSNSIVRDGKIGGSFIRGISLSVSSTDNNVFSDIEISGNGVGVYIEGGNSGNTFENLNIYDNDNFGMVVGTSSYTLKDCFICNNHLLWGFWDFTCTADNIQADSVGNTIGDINANCEAGVRTYSIPCP